MSFLVPPPRQIFLHSGCIRCLRRGGHVKVNSAQALLEGCENIKKITGSDNFISVNVGTLSKYISPPAPAKYVIICPNPPPPSHYMIG